MTNAGSNGEFLPRPNRFRMIIDFRKTVILAPLIGPAAVDDNLWRRPTARGTVSHYRPKAMIGSLEFTLLWFVFSFPFRQAREPIRVNLQARWV